MNNHMNNHTTEKMDKYKVEKKQLTVRDVELSDAGVYHFIAKQSRMGIRERHAINVTVHGGCCCCLLIGVVVC